MLARITRFLSTDIWRVRLADYSRTKSFMLKQLRVIALAVRGYQENSCKFRASALTFYSLLSIVPVIAMLFGIAKGFGLEKRVETEILLRFKGQEEVAEKMDELFTLIDVSSEIKPPPEEKRSGGKPVKGK